MKTFDDILHEIGRFGRYQKQILLLMCLTHIPVGFFLLMPVFSLGYQKHRCAIPGYVNDTYEIQNDFHRYLVNLTIPPSTDESLEYSQCYLYEGGTKRNTTKTLCSSWVYDTSVFTSTFASEQNMVCTEKWRKSLSKMILFVGVLAGSLGLGNLSDIIGRKRTLCLSFMVLIPSSLAISWATSYTVFCVLMFVIGMSLAGVFLPAYIIGAELVVPQKRVLVGCSLELCFALSLLIMTGIAYGLKHWKYISIACSAPCILFLSYWILVPESVRWYIGQGRIAEANKIIERVAKTNKVTTIPRLESKSKEKEEKGRIWHLFATRTLLIRSIIIFINWMVVAMAYFGLSYNVGNLAGDFYLNFFLNGLVECPAYTLVLVTVDRVGRSKCYCFAMLFGGICCISTIFTTLYAAESLQSITVTLAILGKFCTTAGFMIAYIWTSELFPTVVRNSVLGFSSSCARIGAMVSPYIADLNLYIDGNAGRAAPMLVFGSLAVMGGLLALYLPDTVNKELQDTIQEVDTKQIELGYIGEAEEKDSNFLLKE